MTKKKGRFYFSISFRNEYLVDGHLQWRLVPVASVRNHRSPETILGRNVRSVTKGNDKRTVKFVRGFSSFNKNFQFLNGTFGSLKVFSTDVVFLVFFFFLIIPNLSQLKMGWTKDMTVQILNTGDDLTFEESLSTLCSNHRVI